MSQCRLLIDRRGPQTVPKLPNEGDLSVVIKVASSSSVMLSDLNYLVAECSCSGDWLQAVHGPAFRKLEVINFNCGSRQISKGLYLSHPLRTHSVPSLCTMLTTKIILPSSHMQLTTLIFEFPCNGNCSSRAGGSLKNKSAYIIGTTKTILCHTSPS